MKWNSAVHITMAIISLQPGRKSLIANKFDMKIIAI